MMPTIIGEKLRFAIEYAVDSVQSKENHQRFRFGEIRFWLGGNSIGDDCGPTSLGSVAAHLRAAIDDRTLRWASPALCALTTSQLFEELDDGVYATHRTDLLTQDPREELYRAFFVHPPVDVFDRSKIVVVDCVYFQRMIGRLSDNRLVEVRLALGEFERVAQEFCDSIGRSSIVQ
jgi:hypothetical protein